MRLGVGGTLAAGVGVFERREGVLSAMSADFVALSHSRLWSGVCLTLVSRVGGRGERGFAR